MNPQVGAASTHVHDLLTGPAQRGTARRVGRERVAIEVAGRLIVLVPASGPQTLPCTVVVPALEPEHADVGPTLVGGGHLVVGRREVSVVRWWEPARVRSGNAVPRPVTTGAPVLDDGTRRALHDAAAALAAGDTAVAGARLSGVLGRGRGSTPDADDAVAGLLLAARAVAPASALPRLQAVAAQVAQAARTRTTLLSAELLRAAAAGYAAPVLVQHLAAPTSLSAAQVERLGATSGRATLEGVTALHLAWRRTSPQEVAA
ncbi:MAG TPA: DUF2877 domain-containing protein [Angustibacter sp.]|nr:DUF2877 domain-containing protein [Angustibacter sp.]